MLHSPCQSQSQSPGSVTNCFLVDPEVSHSQQISGSWLTISWLHSRQPQPQLGLSLPLSLALCVCLSYRSSFFVLERGTAGRGEGVWSKLYCPANFIPLRIELTSTCDPCHPLSSCCCCCCCSRPSRRGSKVSRNCASFNCQLRPAPAQLHVSFPFSLPFFLPFRSVSVCTSSYSLSLHLLLPPTHLKCPFLFCFYFPCVSFHSCSSLLFSPLSRGLLPFCNFRPAKVFASTFCISIH